MLSGLRAEDLLEAMFASAGTVGLCLTDPDGTVLRMNDGFARWANLDRAALSLHAWLEGDAPSEARMAAAEARAGRLGTMSLHVVAASGTASRWEGKVAPVGAGEQRGMLWSVREAPQEDEARAMREALDALPISLAIIEGSAEGPRLIAYNRAYAELVQQPRPGDPFSTLPYQVYRPDRVTKLPRDEWPGPRAALSGEHVVDTEMHLLRGDGTWRVVSGSAAPLPPKPGAAKRSIAIILDLTARRAAEEALARSEARYRGIFQKLNDQLLVAEAVRDDDGAVVDWIIRETNQASQRELGGDGPPLLGTRASERVPRYFERVHERWCHVLATGTPWAYEARSVGRDDLVRVFRLDDRTIISAALDVTGQKDAERTARILTARYERTVTTVPGALCDYTERLDGSAVFTYLSPGCFDIFERTADELVGNPDLLAQMIVPEDAARLASAEGRGRRDAQLSEEFRIRTPSGKEKWVEYTRRANLGSPPSGSGFLLDISARKQAEARIAEERERLEVTLRSIGDAVIATDQEGKVTLMNLVAEALTGWSANEARGRPVDEVFHILSESDRQKAPNPVHRVLQEGKVVGLANHTALVARDGSERPIADSGAPIRDPSGRMIGTVLVFRDQTEERRAEAAILRSRRELLELVEKLPLGVFVTRDGVIVYANPTFAQYLGHERAAALLGQAVSGLLVREETSPHGERADFRGSARTEWRARTVRGQVVTLEGEGAREIDFEGTAATLWAVQDITELRAMHAQLMQADRLASVGTLAAGIAHEINNPLAYVIGSLDFMAETFAALDRPLPSPSLEEVALALGEAREGAQRVKAVVRDLKTFSRADEERRTAVDLPRLLDSSVNMVSNELRHRARLEKAYAPTPPVVANEARLGQVFLNLVINAVQCLPEGRPEDERIRIVTGTDEAGRALVEIHDSGPGIPDEIRERIFDPFFTTKPIGVGTGLGLAICRNTIEALGGTISVRLGHPRGTIFRVSLPAADSPLESRRPLPSAAPGTRGRVLVVDDEAAVGVALVRLLRKEHDVTAIGRGHEALDRIRSGERWDVILCDLMMPEMTGMELYREVGRVAPEQAARMVFLTGGTFTQQARTFLQEVRNVRVEKPFDSEELRALIRRLRGAAT